MLDHPLVWWSGKPNRSPVQQVIVGVCIPTGGKARGVGQAEEDSLAKMPGDKSGFMLLAGVVLADGGPAS